MDLTAEAIKTCRDLKTEAVEVPEWEGRVYVRTMTGTERDAWEADLIARRSGDDDQLLDLSDIRATLVALCAVDAAGNRLFDESDVGWLSGKSAAALDRVSTAARRLNKLDQQDLEELRGNSPATPAADSG